MVTITKLRHKSLTNEEAVDKAIASCDIYYLQKLIDIEC